MADSKLSFYRFDEYRESIENYLERLNVFCDLQEFKRDKKQQILLTSLIPELYAKVKELVHLQEDEDAI